MLANNGIAISMDGKGARRDNIFVERLWRGVKYQEVYLKAYNSLSEARDPGGIMSLYPGDFVGICSPGHDVTTGSARYARYWPCLSVKLSKQEGTLHFIRPL